MKLTIPQLNDLLFDIQKTYNVRYKGKQGLRINLVRVWNLLTVEQQEIVSYGIRRHIYYCDKSGTAYDAFAIKEILEDAKVDMSLSYELATQSRLYKMQPIEFPSASTENGEAVNTSGRRNGVKNT